MSDKLTLTINGETRHFEGNPHTPLFYVLRNDLKLKSPKYGCGLEQCGACKVIVDGKAVPSCRLPVGEVQGKQIATLESLGDDAQFHALQQAFIQEQAIQCGFCTSGLIMAAKALLDRNPRPSDDEIRAEIAINLCRCGAHNRILRAIKRAAGLLDAATEPSWRVLPQAPLAEPEAVFSPSFRQSPQIDDWVRINSDETVTIFTGKVEIGQGLKTAVAQLGAAALAVSLARIEVVMADTGQTPNEGVTAGSMSLETTGNAVFQAAAEAQDFLLALAAEALEADRTQLTVADGTITDPASGRSTSYWDLFGGQRFGVPVTGRVLKRPALKSLIGQPVTRVDLPAKVTGQPTFVHDLDLPGMLYGRVIRPPQYGAKLLSFDAAAIAAMPGVRQVVRDGDFLAVIAEREEQAIMTWLALREQAVWQPGPDLPDQADLPQRLQQQAGRQSLLVVNGTPGDDPIPPRQIPAAAVKTVQATYHRPYHMHAALGPSAAVAQLIEGKLTVWTHSQGVYPLRTSMAAVLGMAETDLRVIHVEGAGCYGHNGADDAAFDAALLARACPGQPIKLQWSRWDEHAWEPYGPAMTLDLQASLNAEGEIIDWNHDVYSYTHLGRPRPHEGRSGLLAAWHLAEPALPPEPRPNRGNHVGIHRNADPYYAFAQRRVVKHFVPHSPLRVSAMRGLGSYGNVFAIESMLDEAAYAAQIDPVAFRLRHLDDERAKAVIRAAAERANWRERTQPAATGRGQGIAFSRYKNRQCYAATVVELRVDEAGQIHLERVVIAADAGQIVNPDGLANQLEGGFVQAASWTLKEQVTFAANGITSVDWESYPILTFPDIPEIEVVLLDRPDQPFLGTGEGTQGPAPAAIANAIFDATGVRLRQIPFNTATSQLLI